MIVKTKFKDKSNYNELIKNIASKILSENEEDFNDELYKNK